MFNEVAFEKQINKVLDKIADLESSLITLEAQYAKKAIDTKTKKEYELLQEALEDLNAIIKKYQIQIDDELEYFLESISSMHLSEDYSIYKRAFKAGITMIEPFISTTSISILNGGLKMERTFIHSTLESLKYNTNKTIDKIIKEATHKIYELGTPRQQAAIEIATELKKLNITVRTNSGREWRDLVAYGRMNITTAANNILYDLQEQLAKDIGIPNDKRQVQVSSHFGSRIEHANWQGRVFKYQDFLSICKPHTATGIYGINCRHKHYEYIEGISKPIFTQYDEAQNRMQYENTQEQRYLEAGIRRWKQRLLIDETLHIDNSKSKNKVREWQNKANHFAKFANLKRKYKREQI